MQLKLTDSTNKKRLPDIDCELNEKDCAIAFGLSLKRLRKYNNLTLDKLSEEIDIPNPTLNRYESGYNLPSIFMALKISYYFNVNIENMLFAGICEYDDREKGIYKEENKYIEQFVGFNDALNKALNNKTTFVFQDHKKKQRKNKY